MAYSTGISAVKAAIEAANSGGDYSNGVVHPIEQLHNFSLKEGKTKVVRFLTDDLVNIPFHNFVTCLNGKPADFVDTSQLEGELRRPDWLAANMKDEKGKPLRPTKQTVGILVERELNADTNEWEDKLEEFEFLTDPEDPNSPTEKQMAPRFYIIKQGARFWSQMDSWWSEYGTSVDRNYRIKRLSGGTSTMYSTFRMDKPDDGYDTAEKLAELYEIPVLPGFEDAPATGHIVAWIERRGSVKWLERLTGKADEPAEEKPRTTGRPTLGIGARKAAPVADEESNEDKPADTSSLKSRLAGYSIKK